MSKTYRSPYHNARFDQLTDFTDSLFQFWLHVKDDYGRRILTPNLAAEFRLLTRQYQIHRSLVQSLSTLSEIEEWLNQHTNQILLAPLSYIALNRRTMMYGAQFKFDQDYDIDADYLFINSMEAEERITGPTVSARLEVTPRAVDQATLSRTTITQFNIQVVKQALASFGIYTSEIDYNSKQIANQKSSYVLEVLMPRWSWPHLAPSKVRIDSDPEESDDPDTDDDRTFLDIGLEGGYDLDDLLDNDDGSLDDFEDAIRQLERDKWDI